jgi:hypothetical protein
MAVLKNLRPQNRTANESRKNQKARVVGLGRLPFWTAAGWSLVATFGRAGDTAPPPATG